MKCEKSSQQSIMFLQLHWGSEYLKPELFKAWILSGQCDLADLYMCHCGKYIDRDPYLLIRPLHPECQK